jgi:hypothetical protein
VTGHAPSGSPGRRDITTGGSAPRSALTGSAASPGA